MQGQQTGTDIVRYRYNGNFKRFGGKPPEVFYEDYGQAGKYPARGLVLQPYLLFSTEKTLIEKLNSCGFSEL
ncbi:hypothetical protein [Photorhabdus sp. SF281]|uniref:hypothetical protein n=1 Tax=Photorhabdus sp. SF281 TaxID=3459527 RepID=UPI0040443EB0